MRKRDLMDRYVERGQIISRQKNELAILRGIRLDARPAMHVMRLGAENLRNDAAALVIVEGADIEDYQELIHHAEVLEKAAFALDRKLPYC